MVPRIEVPERGRTAVIIRLSVLTLLMALFAVGFSSLVRLDRPVSGPIVASGDCLDTGLVCAPRKARVGL
jgi:hypothetical protein